MPIDNLTFWEPVISPHKVGLLGALCDTGRYRSITYISENELTSDRLQQGWNVNKDPRLEFIIKPDQTAISRHVADHADEESLHVFSGYRWHRSLVQGIFEVTKRNARFTIMSEPRVAEGIKGCIRVLHSLATESKLRQACEMVFAIGVNGPPWFEKVRFDPRRIVPFAYFVDPPEADYSPNRGKKAISYLGRLTKQKGAGVFLAAVAELGPEYSIHIAGTGDMQDEVRQFCDSSEGRAIYYGALPMSEVYDFLSKSDILVAPSLSTDDGWGVNVSEGLHSGCYIICTPMVGASVCVQNSQMGEILTATSAPEIRGAIERGVAKTTELSRLLRSNWARAHLSCRAGASYFNEVVDFLDGRMKFKPDAFYQRA